MNEGRGDDDARAELLQDTQYLGDNAVSGKRPVKPYGAEDP